jgi:hypothetical protein
MSVTGSSEAIIQYVYNICGITLGVVFNISVLYIGYISIYLYSIYQEKLQRKID